MGQGDAAWMEADTPSLLVLRVLNTLGTGVETSMMWMIEFQAEGNNTAGLASPHSDFSELLSSLDRSSCACFYSLQVHVRVRNSES